MEQPAEKSCTALTCLSIYPRVQKFNFHIIGVNINVAVFLSSTKNAIVKYQEDMS